MQTQAFKKKYASNSQLLKVDRVTFTTIYNSPVAMLLLASTLPNNPFNPWLAGAGCLRDIFVDKKPDFRRTFGMRSMQRYELNRHINQKN